MHFVAFLGFSKISTSNSVVPQPLRVLVVELHQSASHVMFQGEEVVVPEHQAGHVNLVETTLTTCCPTELDLARN